MALHYLLFIYLLPLASACESTCGNVAIPRPFGMNHPNCYHSPWFQIQCTLHKPYLKLTHLEVIKIDHLSCKVWVRNPVFRWNCRNKSRDSGQHSGVDLRGSPFAYGRNNVFVGVGCNTQALLQSTNRSDVGGCVSFCDKDAPVNDVSGFRVCQGKYCCKTSLPPNLTEYKPRIEDIGNRSNTGDGDCDYALIADDEIHHVWGTRSRVSVSELEGLDSVAAVLKYHISCNDSNITSSALRCCPFSSPLPVNPPERHRPDSSGSKSQGIPVIGAVFSSLVSIVFLVAMWIQYKIFRKSRLNKRKEKYFKQNGGPLLQRRSSRGDVSFDKTKLFSSKDLEKATDRFNLNRVLGKGGQGTVYKGMLADGQIVAVKKLRFQGNVQEFINEVLILSQINHRHVVKLLGFCLETQVPLLVYEFIPKGNLFDHLHEQNQEFPMTWDMRLRIASEVAGALFYLHSAASRPIYHRDVKSTNILLDDKFRAKVADFGTSKMVSIEKTHITTEVHGTFGYLDPEYFHTSQFTEKSDVYSFGVVLVELLTGQAPIESGRPEQAQSLASYFIMCMDEDRLYDILDPRIMEGVKEDIKVVANLARRCLSLNGKNRPTMREVTTELEGIQKLRRSSNIAQQNYQEIDFVGLFEAYQPWTADCASSESTRDTKASSSSQDFL